MLEFLDKPQDTLNERIFTKEFFGELQAECYHRIETLDDVNNLKIDFENIILTLDHIKDNIKQYESEKKMQDRLRSLGIDTRSIKQYKEPNPDFEPVRIPAFLQT